MTGWGLAGKVLGLVVAYAGPWLLCIAVEAVVQRIHGHRIAKAALRGATGQHRAEILDALDESGLVPRSVVAKYRRAGGAR